jgi:hypothetical protein
VILTPNILVRLVAIVVLGVLLQLSFFSRVSLFEVSPDVLPALVVVLGLLGGTMTGAVAGFSVGFLVKSVFAFFLGWAVFIGARRALRPALVEEPPARRRRRSLIGRLRRRGRPAHRRTRPTTLGA